VRCRIYVYCFKTRIVFLDNFWLHTVFFHFLSERNFDLARVFKFVLLRQVLEAK